jgi:hypothetical protein
MQILGIPNFYPSAPTTAPTSLSNVPSRTSVAISFTAPTDDGGSAITNYEYSFNLSSWTALSPADATSPVTVSGLSPSTAYTVYLRAVNAIGSGPASAGTSFTTLASTLVVQTLVVGGGGKGGNAQGAGGNAAGGGGGGIGAVQTAAQGAGSYTITVGGQSGQSVAYFTGSTVVGNGGAAGANANGNLGGTGGAGGTGTTATGGKGGDSYSGGTLGQAGGAGPTGTIWGVSAQFSGGGGGGGGQGGAGGAGGGGKGGRGQDVVPPPGENGASGSQFGAGAGGGGYSAGQGGTGFQGGVWVSYLTSSAAGMSVTGGSITTSGAYTVHAFTGSSSFTITLV